MSVAEWAIQEALNLEVASSNPSLKMFKNFVVLLGFAKSSFASGINKRSNDNGNTR